MEEDDDDEVPYVKAGCHLKKINQNVRDNKSIVLDTKADNGEQN